MAQYSELHYVVKGEDGEDSQSDEIGVAEVRALLEAGAINASTKVWTDGMEDWVALGSCADLFGLRDALGGSEGEPPEFHTLYYTCKDEGGEDKQSDEITVAQARDLLAAGTITTKTKVWIDGMDDWLPLAECAGRFGLGAVLPEGTPPASATSETVHYESGDAGEDQAEVAVTDLQGLLDSGTVSAETRVWMEGWDEWQPLTDCAEKLGVSLGDLAGGISTDAANGPPLVLHIDKASGLAAADRWGKSDPYVDVQFNGVVLGNTQIIWKTLEPQWDERRQLPPLRMGAQNRLTLDVYDKDDGVARGDFLGQVTVDLNDPANIGTVLTRELAPMAKESAKFNKFVAGHLVFSIDHDRVCNVYVASKNVKTRRSCDIKSEHVGMIEEGDVVEVLEERRLDNSARVRTIWGWATAKNLKTEAENLVKTDAQLGFAQTEGCTCAWLDAKSHARQPWRRYWFELRGGSLTCFKTNSQGVGTDRVGMIPLHSCRGVANSAQSNLALDLDCVLRTWSLRTSKIEERDALLVALSAAVESAGAAGGGRGVTFDGGNGGDGGDDDEDPDDEWCLNCKCEVRTLRSSADPGDFRNLWLSLDNESLTITKTNKGSCEEGDVFLFDVDEDSIKAPWQGRRDSEDPTREFQFCSGNVIYLVRVPTPALVDKWCDALRSVFNGTSKSLYNEEQVHQISPHNADVHLSLAVHGSVLRMHDGHGYSAEVRLAECHSLRRGLRSTGTDHPLEFSLVHNEDGGRPVELEFRAPSVRSRERWFAVVKRELARVAEVTASNPVQKLDVDMLLAANFAPLLDEDIHCVLFNQPGADGDEVESVALEATDVACTVFMPIEEDVGSHGREMLIPFTAIPKTLNVETPVMQILAELVKDVQPQMDPGTPGGTPGSPCRWALFMHRQLGLPPLRCADTDCLTDVREFVWQAANGIQPRLVLADLASQEAKLRLQNIIISTESADATSEFPELAPFNTQIKAVAHMAQEDTVENNRVAMQQRYLLAAHNEGSWADTGGTVQKSMINLTTQASGAESGAASEDEVTFQGWLMKKGGSGAGDQKSSHMFKRRNWKTRCVTLCAKQLMYYDSEDAAEAGPVRAKGGMLFKGASMEVFVAEDDSKRRHQFFLKGETVDGSYAGKRDLVMCAQSAAEFDEWERLFRTHIANANGGEVPLDESSAAVQRFEVAVRTSLEPEAEPFVMECDAETIVQNIVDEWLASKPAEWKAEHNATTEATVVYRRALSEILLHADILVDYDFVHLALSTHSGPQTVRLELTMQVEPNYSEATAGTAPSAADDPKLEFKLHELRWMRPSESSAVYARSGTQQQPSGALADIVERLDRDPFLDMQAGLKGMIWTHRSEFSDHPRMLAKVIQSLPSLEDPRSLRNLDHVLRIWKQPNPEEALQLLDPRFWECRTETSTSEDRSENPMALEEKQDTTMDVAVKTVREYAVHCLVKMPDHEIQSYMLQLSQLMKLEKNLSESPLAALLMYRALRNPKLIGQSLYWAIRSEMYDSSVYTHLSLYLRQYMDHCGPHRQELANQERLMGQLRNTIRHIKSERHRRKAAGEEYSIHVLKEVLHTDLGEITFPPEGIRMPVNPNLRCKSVKIESCKVMGSHQVPLWLVFENYDSSAEPIYIIFKDGDDVRQDTLVLQLFNVMQNIWEEDGLDIPLRPGANGAYGCVSVGFEVGVVEVVTHCNTLAGIVKEAEMSALGVFNKDVYKDWLEKHNETDEKWAAAVDRFTRSCAGYCVATYILGIADRHNDNIMLAQTGELIHIDFGHFLGHVTEFLGLNRDKSPFILTDEFVVIMGGADGAKNPNFRKFVGLCCSCFNSLRKHAHLFINLLSVMLIANLGELEGMQELNFVRTRFMLELDDKQAADKFKRLIQTSLNTLTTKLNWAAHSWVHRNH